MFGAIILRDIPKKEVRIDLIRTEIKGGFRGFNMVPPAAWHYVSVLDRAHHVGFWCYFKPKEAVVKVFNSQDGFQDADAETHARFSQLALRGAMGPALMSYPHERFGPWFGLVNHIPETNFPPTIHPEEEGAGSRMDKALLNTHGGDSKALLAEFQYAFMAWLVSQDTATPDEAAFARWRHLVLAFYNAGERRIRDAGDLFPALVETMMRQFDLLPDAWFGPDSFLGSSQANYLAEDMEDSDVPAIMEKGEAFAAYLRKRRG